MRLAFVFIAICAGVARSGQSQTIALEGAAQGTRYHIKIASPREDFNLPQVKVDVEAALEQIDREMSTYRADSEISRFNRAPAGEWFPMSKAVVDLVSLSREISEKTGGAQDVTVGPLVRLWHFGPSDAAALNKKSKTPMRPPTKEALRAGREKVGYKKLDFSTDPQGLRKQVEGLEIDLSSIAPGYTVDRIAAILRKHEASSFLVELGGEVYAAGRRADGSGWRVAIERPGVGKPEMQTAVPISNAAIATAGGSRHFFEYEGKRYSHVIDPATGRPVEHTLSAVTVAADSCVEADGWDTPLLVLGPERGGECAERNGIAAMFVVHDDNGEAVRTTSAWRKRFGLK